MQAALVPPLPRELVDNILLARPPGVTDEEFRNILTARIFKIKTLYTSTFALSHVYKDVMIRTNEEVERFIDAVEKYPALPAAVERLSFLVTPEDMSDMTRGVLPFLLPRLSNLKFLVVEFSEYTLENGDEDAFEFWVEQAQNNRISESLREFMMVSFEIMDDYVRGEPDPEFFWEAGDFSARLKHFATIERFSIFTDAYPVKPPTSGEEAEILRVKFVRSIPTGHPLKNIFIMASIRNEDDRFDGNMVDPFGPQFGSCHVFERRENKWVTKHDFEVSGFDRLRGSDELERITGDDSSQFLFDDDA